MKLFTAFLTFTFILFSSHAEEMSQEMQDYVKSCENMELKSFSQSGPILTETDKQNQQQIDAINKTKITDFNNKRKSIGLAECAVPEKYKRQAAADQQCRAPEGVTCSDGQTYNCVLAKCLKQSDHERVSKAERRCKGYPEDQRAKCMDEVKTFDDDFGVEKDPSKKFVKKNKTMNTMSTVAGGAYAAYHLFTMEGSVFSMPNCIASPMGLAAGVASFMGQMNLKKQTKKEHQMLKEQYKKVEELKGKEGVSFELQVMALEYYVMALQSSKRIAEAHAKQYSTDMMMYGIVAAIGTAEAVFRPICPGLCDAPGGACGKKGAIGAGIGLGFAVLLKGQSSSAASKYDARAKKVQKILDHYRKLFGNRGGLASSLWRGQTKVTDISKVTSATDLKEAGTDLLDGDQSGEVVGRPGHCATKDGKLDPGCGKCSKDPKSCKTFPSFASIPSQLQGFAKKAGIDSGIDTGNKILSGQLTSSSLNQSAIDARNNNLSAARKALVNHFEKKKVNVPTELKNFDPIAAAKAFAQENKDRIPGSSGSSTPWDLNDLGENGNIGEFIKDKNLAKDLQKVQVDQKVAANNIVIPGAKFDAKSAFDDLGTEDDNQGASAENSNEEAVISKNEAGLKEGEEYDYDENLGEGIVQHRQVSLFKIISNRYNVMRINKRFGRTSKKK